MFSTTVMLVVHQENVCMCFFLQNFGFFTVSNEKINDYPGLVFILHVLSVLFAGHNGYTVKNSLVQT